MVVHGSVGVNESLLTGEPNIIHKAKDDRVLSGLLSQQAHVTIKLIQLEN